MKKVLIAEDSVILADILEFFLESGGYEVCGVAQTVAEAVALADLHQPDLGIFDFRLADGGNGGDIQRRIKNAGNMGILYATGNELSGELDRLEGHAYIQKPYTKTDVLAALKIVSDLQGKQEIFPAGFPVNFHLLATPLDGKRKFA